MAAGRQIELTATENYKVLSGKAERIEWTTEGKTYAVRLISPDGKVRTFEMLSGGESEEGCIDMAEFLPQILNVPIPGKMTIRLPLEDGPDADDRGEGYGHHDDQ